MPARIPMSFASGTELIVPLSATPLKVVASTPVVVDAATGSTGGGEVVCGHAITLYTSSSAQLSSALLSPHSPSDSHWSPTTSAGDAQFGSVLDKLRTRVVRLQSRFRLTSKHTPLHVAAWNAPGPACAPNTSVTNGSNIPPGSPRPPPALLTHGKVYSTATSSLSDPGFGDPRPVDLKRSILLFENRHVAFAICLKNLQSKMQVRCKCFLSSCADACYQVG